MSYNSLLTYGDFIPLKVTCNVNKLFEEIKDFSFEKYNPRKPHINRYGLSITSLNGELGGIDLDSFKEAVKSGEIHPLDAKLGVADGIYRGVADVAKYFEENPEKLDLVNKLIKN